MLIWSITKWLLFSRQEMKNWGALEDKLMLSKRVSGDFRLGVLTTLMGISITGKNYADGCVGWEKNWRIQQGQHNNLWVSKESRYICSDFRILWIKRHPFTSCYYLRVVNLLDMTAFASCRGRPNQKGLHLLPQYISTRIAFLTQKKLWKCLLLCWLCSLTEDQSNLNNF